MKELRIPVTTVQVTCECDCGSKNVMRISTKLSHPPLHVYECKDCGKVETLRDAWPRLEYVPTGGSVP